MRLPAVASWQKSRQFQAQVRNTNPAVAAFLESLGAERTWGQVVIQPEGPGFRLRHAQDRSVPATELRDVPSSELRKLAMFSASGQFRPLRAAPDLRNGWTCYCRSGDELARAIQDLYPGSIPDGFAAEHGAPPVTDYRPFTNRQTGMYRITQLLTDASAARMIRACCHPRLCLKRRWWTVEGLETDRAENKSAIPCLEPCAVLLEFARKTARIEQEEALDVQMKRSELETLVSAAQAAAEAQPDSGRVGNLSAALNPRRLQWVLEKFSPALEKREQQEEE